VSWETKVPVNVPSHVVRNALGWISCTFPTPFTSFSIF
jgi:hypothetical protein